MSRKSAAATAASALTLAQLYALLEQKRGELLDERADLLARVDEIDSVVGTKPSSNGKTRTTKSATDGKSSKGGPSLKAVIVDTLKQANGPISVSEIAEKVTATGYKSSSANFPMMVANRLSKLEGVKRVERGVYQLA